jgi:protocatechuate 4,5-dioxygenase alpha chain
MSLPGLVRMMGPPRLLTQACHRGALDLQQGDTMTQPIPGTVIFDGAQARKGYALNKMCFSFNEAANRQQFLADEDSYCARYGLNAQQREAIRARNVLQLIAAGGNAYYLAKFAGIFGLDMQDIGAQQTGMTKDQFKAKLLAARGQ